MLRCFAGAEPLFGCVGALKAEMEGGGEAGGRGGGGFEDDEADGRRGGKKGKKGRGDDDDDDDDGGGKGGKGKSKVKFIPHNLPENVEISEVLNLDDTLQLPVVRPICMRPPCCSVSSHGPRYPQQYSQSTGRQARDHRP